MKPANDALVDHDECRKDLNILIELYSG